jgi:DNA segregation ATPase FtsK/SpoIIIE, S-DNA-T family
MAYQTRQRDPLLDDRTHAALMRLGQQGVGFALLGAAAALVALLVSYAPEDPNFMAATDAMPQNWLGHFGASVAAILMMIVGYGALLLPLVAAVWGVRFLSQAGQDRVIGRAVFVPIAVALASIHAASFSPGEGWTHSFGLGGLFGDTILGAVLNALPVSAEAGLRILSALAFLGGVALTLYVLAVSRAEFRTGLRFLVLGTLSLIGMVSGGLRSAGQGAGIAAQHLAARRATLRETTAHGHAPATRIGADPAMRRVPIVHDDDDDYGDGDEGHLATARSAVPRQMPGILGRVPLLRPRQPESAAEPAAPLARGSGAKAAMLDPTAGIAPPNEDQIRARITDVIKSRVRRPDAVAEAAARRRGILPGSASLRPAAAPAMVAANPAQRVEPPLTAAHRPAPATATAPPAFVEAVDEEPDNMFLEDAIPEPVAPAPRGFSHALPQTELQRRVMTRAATRHSAQSKQAQAEAQPSLPLQSKPAEPSYEPPSLSFLAPADLIERHHLSDEALEENARMLESVLDDYGVKGEIVSVRPGPVVTMYELEPAPGLKASRVIGLADDIARSMSALSARVSTVPGRSVIGIELPNEHREKVLLRELLSHRSFGDGNHRLPLALGKDIGGDPIIANLAKMPHLLIAGTTGSGKSVAINTMILSLLYKLSPEECRMIMIDPKMLELSVYDGIPHLLSPVVTDPKKAVVALKWVVGEMEERYRKMSKMGVRNIEGYNGRVREALAKGEMFKRTYQTGFDDETGDPVFETEEFKPEAMPFIVVIVDEMADLMMVAGKEIEACIQRLAQMARASGIHLIMATQRPSVDVITGTIKANFPTRISFHVTSKIDSRTILGEQGAEQLLGMGDMLYMAGGAKITRVHGPFVSDEEVEEIVRHLKSFGPPSYASSVLEGPDEDRESDIDAVLGLNTGGNTDGDDALYDQAVAIVIKDRKCSTSYIQRKLGIGYNKAARLVEQMEEAGLVSGANHVGKREILVPEQD